MWRQLAKEEKYHPARTLCGWSKAGRDRRGRFQAMDAAAVRSLRDSCHHERRRNKQTQCVNEPEG